MLDLAVAQRPVVAGPGTAFGMAKQIVRVRGVEISLTGSRCMTRASPFSLLIRPSS
jgi:hypothetical protein